MARTCNFLGGPNQKTDDPYPVGGGNVERLEWETKHGWTRSDSSDAAAEDIQTRRDNKAFEENMARYEAMVRALD